ncbi:hypothetical protein MACH09_44270 [Vibrio sp. MACH09]|nr:hypothetical protein MACH09_44270 [Vibrio sp. MACH09]
MWTKSIVQGIKSSLDESNSAHIYYIDHLDAGRFDEIEQHHAVFRYLKSKFDHKEPDVFISAGPAASHFSLSYPELFPTAKRIVIQPKENDADIINDAVVIDTKIDYSLLVNDALRLSQPKEVFVIGDSIKPSDRHRLSNISNQLDRQNIRYTILDNKDLPTLLTTISNIPSNSAIFFAPIYRVHNGKGLLPVYVLKSLHQMSQAPIFATSVVELGFGSVGGYLHSPTELGMMAGEASLNLIKHQTVTFSHDGFELAYDWNEIIRWQYQSIISPQAEIRFKQPSLWDEHNKEVIIVAIFLTTLTVLLLVLTIYNGKLKKIRFALSKERLLLEKKVAERTKELSLLHQEAEKMARVDELTNISNRRAFFELGESVHKQAKTTDKLYAIIMVDIDRFKNINDTFGHAAGDKVIQYIADTLTLESGASDVVARIGGEEFALMLIDSTDKKIAFIAEQIRNTIAQTYIQFHEHSINVTVSIGCSECRTDDDHPTLVLARADKALYRAKEAGRNRVFIDAASVTK